MKWIKCKDKLPEPWEGAEIENKDLLLLYYVIWESYELGVLIDGGKNGFHWDIPNVRLCDLCDVSHWSKLPNINE